MRSALLGAGCLQALAELALSGQVSSAAVRTAALRCLSDLVAGFPQGQDALGAAAVQLGWASEEQPGPAVPALQAALRSALRAADPAERAAAAELIGGYCRGNADGQLLLASTLAPLGQQLDP